jgi:hypothetical protein
LASLQRLTELKVRANHGAPEIPDALAEAVLSNCPLLRGLTTATSSSSAGGREEGDALVERRVDGSDDGEEDDDDDDFRKAKGPAPTNLDLKAPVANEMVLSMESGFKSLIGTCRVSLKHLQAIAGGLDEEDQPGWPAAAAPMAVAPPAVPAPSQQPKVTTAVFLSEVGDDASTGTENQKIRANLAVKSAPQQQQQLRFTIPARAKELLSDADQSVADAVLAVKTPRNKVI